MRDPKNQMLGTMVPPLCSEVLTSTQALYASEGCALLPKPCFISKIVVALTGSIPI